MSSLLEFPNRSFKNRMAARLPRRSKNGTPDERAAKRQAAVGEIVPISRRAVLAGAAATIPAATVTVTALAAATAEADPIYGRIEAHRAAYLKQATSNRVTANIKISEPGWHEAAAIGGDDQEAFNGASFALLDTMPTTHAGVMALLLYVEQFNRGDFELSPLPEGDPLERWGSGAIEWPILDEEDEDEPAEAQFAWALLANIRAALESLAAAGKAVQS